MSSFKSYANNKTNILTEDSNLVTQAVQARYGASLARQGWDAAKPIKEKIDDLKAARNECDGDQLCISELNDKIRALVNQVRGKRWYNSLSSRWKKPEDKKIEEGVNKLDPYYDELDSLNRDYASTKDRDIGRAVHHHGENSEQHKYEIKYHKNVEKKIKDLEAKYDIWKKENPEKYEAARQKRIKSYNNWAHGSKKKGFDVTPTKLDEGIGSGMVKIAKVLATKPSKIKSNITKLPEYIKAGIRNEYTPKEKRKLESMRKFILSSQDTPRTVSYANRIPKKRKNIMDQTEINKFRRHMAVKAGAAVGALTAANVGLTVGANAIKNKIKSKSEDNKD